MPLPSSSQVKFSGSVAGRINTVNSERQLLHCLLSSILTLQRLIGRHRSDYFTNRSRLFIYERLVECFNDRRTLLTRENLEFELQKRFDSAKDKATIDDVLAEHSVIMKTEITGDPEGIIRNLEDVQLCGGVESLIRQSYSMLEEGRYEEAASLLRQKSIDLRGAQKENRIINLHKDSDDWFEEVRRRKEHPELYAGVKTGFEKFDERTGGLFPAELTIVFGLSGKGKSTFMKALSCNIRKQGRVVLHCGNEENEFQMRSKYMSADSGEKYFPFKNGKYTDEEYRRLKIYSDSQREIGAIYVYEFPQQTDATWIERAYRFLEMQGVKVDVIVVDYLDLMKPIAQAYSENDEGGKITSDLKQVAINCNCPLVTATQAGIQSEKQEKKAKPFLNASDVFGTKRKVHSANTLIGIVNQTATAMAQDLPPEERKRHKMVLCVPKNRDGAVFTFRQVMDVECGRFYEDTDEDDPVMNNLERQATEMIDDTVPPDKMRSEISTKELQEAKKAHLDAEMEKIRREMEESDREESSGDASTVLEKMRMEDEAFSGKAKDDFFDVVEDDSLSEEPLRATVEKDEDSSAGGDDFFGEGEDESISEETDVAEVSKEPFESSDDDFLTAPEEVPENTSGRIAEEAPSKNDGEEHPEKSPVSEPHAETPPSSSGSSIWSRLRRNG